MNRILRMSRHLIGTACVVGCSSSEAGLTPHPVAGTIDFDLFAAASAAVDSRWTYFGRSPAQLVANSGRAHAYEFVRIRYDEKAAGQLDAAGRVKSGARFTDSSTIVKELYEGGALRRYAVMRKLPASGQAGAGGWVWAEYEVDGRVAYSAGGRGGACGACHSAGVDFTRTNDSHP